MSKKKLSTAKKRRAGSARQRHKPRSWMRKVVLPVGVIAAFVVGTYYVWPFLSPAPTVVEPTNPAELDPAVKALIEPKIAAVETSPRNAAAHADLGLAYEGNGLWNEALLCFTNATKLDGSNVDWHIHKAIVARQAGDFDTALSTLREQSQEHPSSAPLQHHYADALLEAGDLDEAERAFRKVMELSPQTAHGYVGLGDILIQKNRSAEAVPVLKQAVELQPTYRHALYLLGRAYSIVGRDEDAEATLTKGQNARIEYLLDGLSSTVAAYTVNVTGRIGQASAYLDAGNPQQAARLLEETYRFHSTDAMFLNTLASAYLRTNRLEDAERLLLRARDIDGDQFFTFLNLYQWALRSGSRENALSFADEAIRRAPERDDTHLARAQALTELGRLDEALESANEALAIDARKASNHGLTGEIYRRLGRYQEADEHFEEALDLDNDLLPALVGLAQTKWSLEKYLEARQILARAQQRAPNHPRVQQVTRQFETSR